MPKLILVKHSLPAIDPAAPAAEWRLAPEGLRRCERLAELYDAGDGVTLRVGVSVNELTASEDRDFLAGTPWHKHVPAQLERL